MKKTILIGVCLLLTGVNMHSQVKIGENGEPARGALLDLNGTYKGGLLLPNVAITDLGVIPAGFTERGGDDTAADLTGMIVWSTDPVNAGLYMWDGDNWQSLMCQGAVAPCTNPAPAPTAISIPAGPFANGEAFEVSCTATEDGTTFYIWTVPAGLSITAGTGTKTIRVSGTVNTYNKSEFTVYAVNPCGTSAAVNGGTGTITVLPNLVEPSSVSASSTTVCSGTATTLSYSGGNGTTFKWYSSSCGGTSVGTGNNVSVSPTATTTYYGRWENGSAYSACKSVTVTVNNVPATPGTMTLSSTSITQGSTFTASVGAVSGATSYVWTLPSGLTGTSTTASITITTAISGTYNAGTITVAASNTCGTSSPRGSASDVTVTPNVTDPSSVSASSTTVCRGTATTLSYTGGSGTTFKWYSGSCGGTQVGTGNNLYS